MSDTINPHTGKEWPHPSRVTVSDDEFQVTGLLPRCPECPLAERHEGDHLPVPERELTTIGDVSVHVGEPPDGNPYRGHSGLMGPDRAAALRAFRDGADTSRWTYWHAPASGGARRIYVCGEIDWRGMGP